MKKVYAKFKAAEQEVNDLQEEFQTEKVDMLDSIRELSRINKLKALIISNFIPEDFAKGIEQRAEWNDEEDCWEIPVSSFSLLLYFPSSTLFLLYFNTLNKL